MEKQILGRSSIEASNIALGCMRMTDKTVEEAKAIIQTALDNGINFFDHADIYGGGNSEIIFKEAFQQLNINRNDVIIQSKVGIRPDLGIFDFSYDHIINATNNILERLDTDYLDILLLHRPDTLMDPKEIAKAFTQLHNEKKVLYFGVSNASPMQIELIETYLPFKLIVDQVQFGIMHSPLVDEGFNVNHTFDKPYTMSGSLLEYSRLHDITLQAWSPFQYGYFEGVFIDNPKFKELNVTLQKYADKYNVSKEAIAVSWILTHPAHIQVIIGSMNPTRISNICKGSTIKLTNEEWYTIYKSAGNILP